MGVISKQKEHGKKGEKLAIGKEEGFMKNTYI